MQVLVWISRAARVAAMVGRFLRRRWRLTALVVFVALLVGPLLLSGDVAVFGLNGLGLGFGFGGMLVRRFLLWCAGRMLRR